MTRVWPTQRSGGMPFVCADRAEALARAGYDVHVVTTSDSTKEGTVLPHTGREENGVMVHYTPTPAHKWTREFAVECAAWANSLSADIIHSESFDRQRVWWGDKKVSITMHGLGFGGWLTQWNLGRAYGHPVPAFPTTEIMQEVAGLRTAHRVLAVSLWEQRLLLDQYGVMAHLVYNLIALHFFGPSTSQVKRGFLCAAVSQGATRGFFVARQAARMAGVKLWVAAGQPRTAMVGAYDRATALVLPTAFAQGFDLSVAEARARGVPMITCPTGSYLDEIETWDRLVGIGDVESLAAAMREEPRAVPAGAADRHRPEEHVRAWLQAVA